MASRKLRCPDCNGVEDHQRHLQHDGTCPHWLAVEAVCDDDRDWFALRPQATERHRPITVAEVAEKRLFGAEVEPSDYICVIQLERGVRARLAYVRPSVQRDPYA